MDCGAVAVGCVYSIISVGLDAVVGRARRGHRGTGGDKVQMTHGHGAAASPNFRRRAIAKTNKQDRSDQIKYCREAITFYICFA